MYVIVCGCVFTFVIWKLEADTVEYWHPKVRNCLTTFSYIKPICVVQVIHNIPWICSHTRDLLHRTRMRGPLSQEPCCGRRPASVKGTIGSAISVFLKQLCWQLLSAHINPHLRFYIISLSFLCQLMPVLSVQWMCCFEEPCSFPFASTLLPFLLGSLARQGGGGGGGILQCLPWEKLLEDWVHLATDLLWE